MPCEVLNIDRYYLALTLANDSQANEIHCVYFEGGQSYEVDGTVIGDINDAPFSEDELDTICQSDVVDEMGILRV